MITKEDLLALANNEELLEIGRLAIEDVLVAFRDAHFSMPLRNNGLVIKTKDGTPSSIIRFGSEQGLSIALKAIAETLHD